MYHLRLTFPIYIAKIQVRYCLKNCRIVEDCSWAMPSLNMLMYSKIIKPVVHVQYMPSFYTLLFEVDFIFKPVVHVQNMPSFYTLLFEVDFILPRIEHIS